MSLTFDQPDLLWLAALALPIVVLGWWTLGGLDALRRTVILGLRAFLLVALVVMLAGPHLSREHDQLTVIGLLDVSGSVKRFARLPANPESEERRAYLQYLRDWFRTATGTRAPDDRFGLVVFDGEAVAVAAPSRVDTLDDIVDVTETPGTSIEDAIRLGLAMFPADTARRLVLVTDGNETLGSALAAARQAAGAAGETAAVRARGAVPIDVLPIAYRVRGDVQIARIESPPNAQPGQTITVRIIMEATEPTRGRIILRREGEPVDLNGARPGRSRAVDVPEGESVQIASVVLGETPVNRFEAIFEPDDPALDVLPDNNRAEAFTSTPGKGRILVVTSRREPGVLEDLLDAAELPRTSLDPEQLPSDLLAFQRYDLIVLDDVPAYSMSADQQELISRYVNDLGGGLIMLGGESSFGAGGWNGTKVEAVLPLELDPPKELRLPEAALVLVLDQSGSMNRSVAGARASQQEVANEAAAMAIESLRTESLVGVVTFHSFATVYVPLARNDDPKAIAQRVRGITAGGGTNLEPALRTALRMLENVQADRKRVVCLTDGQSPDDDLDAIVESMVDRGIRLTTIAVGDDADHATLRRLAELGQGEFYPVYNPKALPRVLVDSVKSINKPLIKESPFVPVIIPTGSAITAGLDQGPPLGGLVVTAPRPEPDATIEMRHPDGEPLYAQWQAGLGRVAAFTSDIGGRWSQEWSAWPPALEFWTQMIRTTARPAVSHDAELVAEIRDGRLEMTLEASDENGFIDYLLVRGTVYPPEGPPIPVRLPQTAPGRYGASVPARAAGNYIVALNPMRGTNRLAPVIGGTSRSTGDEFRRYRSNLALLDRIVDMTGGRRLDLAAPEAVALFDRTGMPVSVSLRPVWRTLLYIVIALLLLDVASRRVAWSAAGIRAAFARAIARVTPAHVRGGEAAATLASLRQVSAEFGDRVRVESDRVTPLGPPPPVKPPVHDVSDTPEPSRVTAALNAFLGRSGTKKDETEERPAAPGPEPEPDRDKDASTETTSNLLAAKRRARERLK